MASPFQVNNEDIKALQPFQLVEVLWQLVNLELATHGIEAFDSQVPLSIYIKDGGIDGLARWEGGPPYTPHFPSRMVGFQAKATDMSEAACASEVMTKDGQLKAQVRRVLEAGGDYVVFLGRDCVQASKEPRLAAILKAVKDGSAAKGGTPINAAKIRIYDASDIAAWANVYPAAVAGIGYFLHRSIGPGMGWSEMSRYSALQYPFVELDANRSAAMRQIREEAKKPRNIIRVVGQSGLGKTRLVFEAFRPPASGEESNDPHQAALSSMYCHVSATRAEGIEQLLVDWRRLNRSGVVVVDDCPYELHERLSQEVSRVDSRLTLISIGSDREVHAYAGTNTKLLVIEPTSDDAIEGQLAAAFADLPEQDRKFIAAELTQGYPLMAILVALARKANAPLSARLTQDVLSKLLGRDAIRGTAAEKVISVCSLFEYVGVHEEVAHEREFVRQTFCPDVSSEEFYNNIVEFERSGALSRYGRVVQVRPRPLAIRLASDWWERCSPEAASRIVQMHFPEALANAFCERLRMLDFVPALRDVTAHLCGPKAPFGQAEVLSSKLGSQLFRAICEVNPQAAVHALVNTFADYDDAGLKGITGEARRNIVWALEKLCFRADFFDQAAYFLARLAASENEKWSNNATGVFKRLFMILLSGTQAPLAQRLQVIQAAARSGSESMAAVAVVALENAIRTHSFSGISGPEYQGSAGPLPQYRPKLWQEVFDYWRSCLEELVRLAISDGASQESAASAIASNIRGLLQQGRVDDVESAVLRVARAKNGVWPAAMDGIRNSLKYDGNRFPEDVRQRLNSWLGQLDPQDIPSQLALHVTEAPYDSQEDKDGNWVDLAALRAEKLGADCVGQWTEVLPHLPALLRGQQQQAFMFGSGLSKGSGSTPQLLQDIISALEGISFDERNSAILSGWLSSRDATDAAQVNDTLISLADSKTLSKSLPSICRGLRLNDLRVQLLAKLTGDGAIEPRQLHGLSYGQSMAAVSATAVADLCNVLLTLGAEGAWVALDITYMYVYGDSEKWASMVPTLTSILCTKGMLSSCKPEWRFDGHAYASVAKKLMSTDLILARALTDEVIEYSRRSREFSQIDHSVEEVLSALLEVPLDAAWPSVSAMLADADGMRRWRFGELLKSSLGEQGKPGTIDKMPLAHLQKWCAERPDIAPVVLAGLINALERVTDDEWRLSVAAMFLLDTYGGNESVLSALSANLGSYSWSGSLVPFYERQISVLLRLAGHRLAEVRQWSQRLIASAVEQAQSERQRDAEQQVGRY